MNIIVGENESGKSTVLEAIKIVINQQYKNSDKSVLKDLFNVNMVEAFKKNPNVKNLPYISIELQMDINPKSKNSEYFYGQNNRTKEEQFGISFECKFDEELGASLENEIKAGQIPYEFYHFQWKTFAGLVYYLVKKPLNFLSIDTSNADASNSFNYYNRTLFNSRYEDNKRMSVKNSFREKLNYAFEEMYLEDIDTNRKFGINDKKVTLETIISVYENSIALENKGSGMESLIKTQIALDKNKSNRDVILIEEPENHLCFSNMQKMLQEIISRQSDSQIIITTHSNMIASRLNLNNVIWIANEQATSLQKVNHDTAKFFAKADDNSFLQLLLSKKTILVEGATEFLLLPKLYSQYTNRTIEEDGVTIISCNGISYKNYIKIAKDTNKKIAIITDNDKNKIDDSNDFNLKNDMQKIFMGNDLEDWTWEVSFYRINKKVLDAEINVDKKSKYLFHGEDYGQVLGKMLNNKVDIAYKMLISDTAFEIPQYVKDAILWLNE